MDVRGTTPLIQKLRTRADSLGVDEIRAITECLFLPADPVPAAMDFCLILGSRRCEYRVQAALDRYGKGPHRFIVSGGGLDAAGRTEAERMRDYLRQRGVAPDQILEERASHHTRENLTNTKALLTRLGAERKALSIGVVTGGFHLRRTAALLAKEWEGRSSWRVSYCPAYGPNTHPDRWHESAEGRKIVGAELAKVSALAGLAGEWSRAL